MERFDSLGRFLKAEIDSNGHIVYTNPNHTRVPKSNIISLYSDINILSENYIKTIKLDRTNTLINKECSKCKKDIMIIIKSNNKVFYICYDEDCDNVIYQD